jgi:hypothetical protein
MLLFHVNVDVVADKYQVPRLRLQAARHVARFLNLMLKYATKHSKHAKVRDMLDLSGLLERLYEVMAAEDERCLLRKAVSDVLMAHKTTNPIGPPRILVDEVMECAREIEGFGKDVYVRTMAKADKLEETGAS